MVFQRFLRNMPKNKAFYMELIENLGFLFSGEIEVPENFAESVF